MPKSIVIDPKVVRKPGKIEIPPIMVNQYAADPKKEEKKFGKKRLAKIYLDMLFIREFESMLAAIKTAGRVPGGQVRLQGPGAPLPRPGVGGGRAVPAPGVSDFIFGSHRSHGEILAKCFSAVDKLEEAELSRVS